MTAEQLRTFRRVVRGWHSVDKYGTGGAAMEWSEARSDFERAIGMHLLPTECWLEVNTRINAATRRLLGLEDKS